MTGSEASTTHVDSPLQSLIGSRILVLREQRVMLDTDLAELYGVETRVLMQAVKRRILCFVLKIKILQS